MHGLRQMKVVCGSGGEHPIVACRLRLPVGSRYEMSESNAWHSVRPLGGPSYSLMVAGPSNGCSAPKLGRELGPLDAQQRR